jgi:hypothetical protein
MLEEWIKRVKRRGGRKRGGQQVSQKVQRRVRFLKHQARLCLRPNRIKPGLAATTPKRQKAEQVATCLKCRDLSQNLASGFGVRRLVAAFSRRGLVTAACGARYFQVTGANHRRLWSCYVGVAATSRRAVASAKAVTNHRTPNRGANFGPLCDSGRVRRSNPPAIADRTDSASRF